MEDLTYVKSSVRIGEINQPDRTIVVGVTGVTKLARPSEIHWDVPHAPNLGFNVLSWQEDVQ